MNKARIPKYQAGAIALGSYLSAEALMWLLGLGIGGTALAVEHQNRKSKEGDSTLQQAQDIVEGPTPEPEKDPKKEDPKNNDLKKALESMLRKNTNTQSVHTAKQIGKAAANIAAADAVSTVLDKKDEVMNKSKQAIIDSIGHYQYSLLKDVADADSLSVDDKVRVMLNIDPELDSGDFDYDTPEQINSYYDYYYKDQVQNQINAIKQEEAMYGGPFWRAVDDMATKGVRTASELYKFSKFGYGKYAFPGLFVEGVKYYNTDK